MTDNTEYEGGLTDEAWDRAEQAGRIHELEQRIADPKAAEIARLEQQLAEARALQEGQAHQDEANGSEGAEIARQWNEQFDPRR